MTNINTRKTGILVLIRNNWQGYLWRILFSVTAVLIMAIAQHLAVLKIPFEELTPRLYFIPTLVGATVGFFYTTIRMMQNEQKQQLVQLAVKEDQLLKGVRK